ncbi:MAG TPA: PQQ-binding-like beta-propeller repeat protein [Gaiellaceae bacterium]|nr:PQQ-binding-like beta-propeller repeat protein [Gaiellaceae bacterium]
MTAGAALAAAVAVCLCLLPRRREALLAGLVVLAAAEAILARSLVPAHDLHRAVATPLHVAAILAGLACVGALAVVLYRRPAWVPVLVLAAAPFRIPVTLGSQDAFLLIPLYVVLAAAALALIARAVQRAELRAPPLALAVPLVGYVALACVSYLWTEDRAAGGLELVFFLLPFALLAALVSRAPVERWLPKALALTMLALGVLFAVIGLWQSYTHTLFFAPTLAVANAYTTFFRVTSLFKDPSLYGRHLVLAISVLLVLTLGKRIRWWWGVAGIAFFWLALYPSYSQSSMVALIVVAAGIAAVLGDRRDRLVLVATVVAMGLVGLGLLASRAQHSPLHAVTRGRSTLVTDSTRAFLKKPIAGVGIGAQPRASAPQPDRKGSRARSASHTTVLTVAAELGIVGLLAYAAIIGGAVVLLRDAWRRERLTGLGLAAAFSTIFVQSFVYSGFFEDPLMWGSLAGAALCVAPRREQSFRDAVARLRRRRLSRTQAVLGLIALAVVGAIVGAALVRHLERPSSGGLVSGTSGVTVSTVHHPKPAHTHKPAPSSETPCWPEFGGSPTRTLSRPSLHLGLPGHPSWVRGMHDLMEYPPSYCDGRLYVDLEGGMTVALDARTGRILWRHRAPGFTASTPAIGRGRVIVSSHGGTVTALRSSDGALLWQLKTGVPVESSPVVVGNAVYVGASDGRLFSLDQRTGKVRWTYDVAGRISSSPSVLDGRVFITTYSGGIFCLHAGNGRRIWSRFFGRNAFEGDSFYSSASTDGIRVFAASKSGLVVALSVADGHTIWSADMGGTVYGTPSVAHGLVNVADLSGHVRAFRAGTGAEVWSDNVSGRVLGPTLVVGGLVFFSTLEGRTYAAQTATGRIVWQFGAGKYSPGIATADHYYFSLNGLLVAFR